MAATEAVFVRGDHGGNTIAIVTSPTLQDLHGRLGDDGLRELGVMLMSDAYLNCDQIGFLGTRHTMLAMSRADGAEIPVCGGLVQVYGAFLRMMTQGASGIVRFPSVEVPFSIEPERILADMSEFACMLKQVGCKPLPGIGPTAYQAGHLLVLSTRDIPPADKNGKFLDHGTRSQLLLKHNSFSRLYSKGAHALVYYHMQIERTDAATGAKKMHVDAVFPHGLTHEFSEPSCGTGSIALALALDSEVLIIHCGDSRWTLGGPCKAHVLRDRHGHHLYWHDTVRVTATGRVFL